MGATVACSTFLRVADLCCLCRLCSPPALQVDEGCRQLQSLLDRGSFAAAGGTCSVERAAADGSSSGDSSSSSIKCSRGSTSSSGSSSSSTGVPWEELFRLLSDDRRLENNPERLPKTGCGPEFEAAASGIFVQASLLPGRLVLGCSGCSAEALGLGQQVCAVPFAA